MNPFWRSLALEARQSRIVEAESLVDDRVDKRSEPDDLAKYTSHKIRRVVDLHDWVLFVVSNAMIFLAERNLASHLAKKLRISTINGKTLRYSYIEGE
jgi:hypothetical protein